MTKPNQDCTNALHCLCCVQQAAIWATAQTIRVCVMVIYEWWVIFERHSFSFIYLKEHCVTQILSNSQSKQTLLFETCIEQLLTLYTDEFSLSQQQKTKLLGWGNPLNSCHKQLNMQTECRPLQLHSTSACRSSQEPCESRLFSGEKTNNKNRSGLCMAKS